MAHRIEPAPNTVAPLAIRAESLSGGRLEPFDPAKEAPLNLVDPWEAPGEAGEHPSLELLGIDQTLLPSPDPLLSDRLWLSTGFSDRYGRWVSLSARGVAGPRSRLDGYRGVVMNGYDRHHLPGGEILWCARPLLAWGRFDVAVDGVVTDESILGVVELFHHPATGTPVLSLTVHPRQVDDEGNARAVPLIAAEEMGMAGWRLRWSGVEYVQAPVVRVRVERGDTWETIADEFSVDPLVVRRANRHVEDPFHLPRGETLTVPLLPGRPERRKRVHPSTSLSWFEIVRGWTAFN